MAYRDALTHLLILARGDGDSEQDSPMRPVARKVEQPRQAQPKPPSEGPHWSDVWRLEQFDEYAVGEYKYDDDHGLHWYLCTYDGVTEWVVYKPSNDATRAVAEANYATKRISGKIKGGGKHPKIVSVTYKDDVLKAPAIAGPLSPGD